jgi:hypothetical protein
MEHTVALVSQLYVQQPSLHLVALKLCVFIVESKCDKKFQFFVEGDQEDT